MQKGFFGYLPVSLFSSVMGLSALCVAFFKLGEIFESGLNSALNLGETLMLNLANFSFILALIFAFLSVFDFIFLSFAYFLKIVTNFKIVLSEWQNPNTKVFFATFFISLLLLAMVIEILALLLDLNSVFFLVLSNVLWAFGAILMIFFALFMINLFIEKKQDLKSLTPALILPIVGLLDIPLFMGFESFFYFDLSEILAMLSLGVGLFFALILFILILARIVFFEKLEEKIAPTIVILLAPFALGFNAYLVVFQPNDNVALLFFIALFLFFALLPSVFKIKLCCPFRVSWWAISFPLAILCNAALEITKLSLDLAYFYLSIFLLSFTFLIFLWLIYRTLSGVFSKELANLS